VGLPDGEEICNFRYPDNVTLRAERHIVWMSKITLDGGLEG